MAPHLVQNLPVVLNRLHGSQDPPYMIHPFMLHFLRGQLLCDWGLVKSSLAYGMRLDLSPCHSLYMSDGFVQQSRLMLNRLLGALSLGIWGLESYLLQTETDSYQHNSSSNQEYAEEHNYYPLPRMGIYFVAVLDNYVVNGETLSEPSQRLGSDK